MVLCKIGGAKLVDTGSVAATFKVGREKGSKAGAGHILGNQPRAHGDHIGVVMLARKLRRSLYYWTG